MEEKKEFHKWLLDQLFIYQQKRQEQISNKKFSELLGVSATVFSQWLSGKKKPSARTAQRIEKLFDSPEVYKILGTERPNYDKKEVIRKWDNLSVETQVKILEIIRLEIP